jgi:DNA-directed RNA polymerase beta subunit
VDGHGKYVEKTVNVRYRGDFLEVAPDRVDYMDTSPKQLVSVAAGLIPFLEHDDANRALMGSNMQRQAVPLLQSERPYVGTGMESRVARDSGVLVIAEEAGKVAYVSGSKHRRVGGRRSAQQEDAQERLPDPTTCASSCAPTPAPASTRSPSSSWARR